jgi:Domain of unknown function (DUF4386)
MLKVSDGRNFGRTLAGLCLIAGPALLLIAQIVSPDVDNDNKVKELADVAAHKSAYIGGAALFLVGGLFLLGAAVGVMHVFRGRKVGLGQLAGGLLLLGSAATVAFYAFTTVEYEMVNQTGLDRAQMAKLLDKANEATSGAPIFLLFIVGIVLGLILLGIAAWRRRIVPRWAAVLMVVSGPLAFASESKAIGIVTFAVLIVALGSLGLALLRMTDEEWDAPRDTLGKPPADAPGVTPAAAPAA